MSSEIELVEHLDEVNKVVTEYLKGQIGELYQQFLNPSFFEQLKHYQEQQTFYKKYKV